jgi:hypothetical protein
MPCPALCLLGSSAPVTLLTLSRLLLRSVSSASLSKAVRDSGDGFGAIVTQASQYQINDVRSIKMDSFEVRLPQVQRQCSLLSVRVLAYRVRKAVTVTLMA